MTVHYTLNVNAILDIGSIRLDSYIAKCWILSKKNTQVNIHSSKAKEKFKGTLLQALESKPKN